MCYNAGAGKQPVSFARVTNAPNAWDISRMTEKWVLKDSWSLVMKFIKSKPKFSDCHHGQNG